MISFASLPQSGREEAMPEFSKRVRDRVKETQMRSAMLSALLLLMGVATSGCGKIPLLSENRTNFAPWEKCPEQGGIRYLGKLVQDPGHDPLYLALIKYESDADVEVVVQTFGLTLSSIDEAPVSYALSLPSPPVWFPLKNATVLYCYPPRNGHLSNLWIDPDEKVMVVERTWY